MGSQNVEIGFNQVNYNDAHGIFYEISSGASIHDNTVTNNGTNSEEPLFNTQIFISNASDNTITSNTITFDPATQNAILLFETCRYAGCGNNANDPPNTTVGNNVTFNLIYLSGSFGNNASAGLAGFWATQEDAQSSTLLFGGTNLFDSDSYYYGVSEAANKHWQWDVPKVWDDFRVPAPDGPGQEPNGQVINP